MYLSLIKVTTFKSTALGSHCAWRPCVFLTTRMMLSGTLTITFSYGPLQWCHLCLHLWGERSQERCCVVSCHTDRTLLSFAALTSETQTVVRPGSEYLLWPNSCWKQTTSPFVHALCSMQVVIWLLMKHSSHCTVQFASKVLHLGVMSVFLPQGGADISVLFPL